jgi:hypothetical protein
MHFYNTKDSAVPLDQPYLEPYKKVYFDEHIIGDHYGTFSEDGKYFVIQYLGWVRIYDINTKELNMKFYLPGGGSIFDNYYFYILHHNIQYKYDISTIMEVKTMSNKTLSVYPNPNLGRLTVEANILKSNIYKLKVVNSIGQEVFFNNMGFLKEGFSSLEFELNLPNGSYQLILTDGIENYNSQFIINK